MSKLALPLQLLLALALVLNGIGAAMAGVLVAPVSEAAAAMTAMAAADADDCAGHGKAITDSNADIAADPAPTAGCHSGGDADCGDSAQCLQACLHAPAALAPQFTPGLLAGPADAILHPLASGHPAPPRPDPIRPPIA